MSGGDQLQQLERLEQLHAAGALTTDEFNAEKRRVLEGTPRQIGLQPEWRSIRRNAAFIVVAGIVIIGALTIMPAPKRAVDLAPVDNGATAAPTIDGNATQQVPIAAGDRPAQPVIAEQTAPAGPSTVKGRCLLRIKGSNYLDGPCDIALDADGSFDIFERFGAPGFFAKVMRDGATAQGYWNGSRDSDHAQDDLGELTRNGACWENATARICAWR